MNFAKTSWASGIASQARHQSSSILSLMKIRTNHCVVVVNCKQFHCECRVCLRETWRLSGRECREERTATRPRVVGDKLPHANSCVSG